MSNPVKDQYKPIFGQLFAQITQEPDWNSIDSTEKARRLEQAFHERNREYGQLGYPDGGSLFEHAIKCLELPD